MSSSDRVAFGAVLGAGVALAAVAATLGLSRLRAFSPLPQQQPVIILQRDSSDTLGPGPGGPGRRQLGPMGPTGPLPPGVSPAPEPSAASYEPSPLRAPQATRGPAPGYEQVGVLTKRDEDTSQSAPTILPLYGRPMYAGASRWQYFTSNDKFHVMKLPVVSERGRSCSKEHGCDQIQEGEQVTVPQYRAQFDVTLYNVGLSYDPTVL